MPNLSRVYVGSLTRRTAYFKTANGEGISVLDFDEDSGTLERRHCITGTDNPSFITFDRDRRHLYATSEVFGWNEGTVTAFAVQPDGGLRYINKQPSRGSITTHCSLDDQGAYLFATNYAHEPWGGYGPDIPGHAVTVLPIAKDGSLEPPISSVIHAGTGPVPDRQTCPHPHCAVVSADGRFVIVADLGTDLLHSYRLVEGKLTTAEAPPPLALPPGSGPRSFIFAPGGRQGYLINELGGTIAHLDYDSLTGAFSIRQLISTLPEGFTALNNCADLHLSPDSRFLYASNRGHDSIARFSVDPVTGGLALLGHTATGGEWPRNFALTASGKFLLVANQDSDSITIFRRNDEDGGLTHTGSFAIGTPLVLSTHAV
jgi:6-phosphogluconolactonase